MRTTTIRTPRPAPGRLFARLALVLATLCVAVAADASRPTIDAWPFLELDEDTTTVLYPLYSREGDSVTVFPFYYRTHQGRDHHVLWPLVKLSDGRLERAAPFWFAGEGEYTFFPFIHRTKSSTTLLVPPAHWRHDGDFVAFLPFYVRAGASRFYAPSIFVEQGQRMDGEQAIRKLTVFPLFHFRRSLAGPHRELNVLLIARSKWGKAEREMMLLPLGALRTGGRDDYVWLGPYYRDDTHRVLLPVYYEHENSVENDRWILTWRQRRTDHSRVDAVYPFYAESRERHGRDRERHELSALWPLYHRDEVRSDAGQLQSRSRRFLIFTDERSADGTRRFKLFGLPVSETIEPPTPVPAEGEGIG